jgi:capsular exopolysaccharide synthesis family protein
MQVILAAMRAQMDSIKQRLQAFERQFDAEQKDAVDLATFQTKLQQKKENLESSKRLFEQILQRAQEVRLVKAQENGGYEARMIHPPGLGRKIAPNPLQVFPLSAILGLAAGVGLAYLAELSDKSFRTPAEIRRRLGLPVIGHIPFFDSDEAASKIAASGAQPEVDPMVIAHYQSNSIAAEAYRGVRTALYFNSQGVGHQVIQVTSPNVSDGKSTLAANLAVSIAQSGKRTILIDGDCRKPKVHKFFNVSQETGLASVIAGTADLDVAVKQSAVPNLSILPCGPRPVNPAELLTSPRFKELLDMIRSRYEFVIVDTPPLLVVTDPCVVAPRVDGVVLTIRVTKNGRPYAERAKEILASLGANVIGVVVNGFGGGAGGRYGYEHYQYGYGYGYG